MDLAEIFTCTAPFAGLSPQAIDLMIGTLV
jgi:hypothetical protein